MTDEEFWLDMEMLERVSPYSKRGAAAAFSWIDYAYSNELPWPEIKLAGDPMTATRLAIMNVDHYQRWKTLYRLGIIKPKE